MVSHVNFSAEFLIDSRWHTCQETFGATVIFATNAEAAGYATWTASRMPTVAGTRVVFLDAAVNAVFDPTDPPQLRRII